MSRIIFNIMHFSRTFLTCQINDGWWLGFIAALVQRQIIVNDLTVTECVGELIKSEKTLKKSLTTALGYEIIDHNQVENPPRGEKY